MIKSITYFFSTFVYIQKNKIFLISNINQIFLVPFNVSMIDGLQTLATMRHVLAGMSYKHLKFPTVSSRYRDWDLHLQSLIMAAALGPLACLTAGARPHSHIT